MIYHVLFSGGIKITYRFSIIIPAYNVEKYISKSLDSLVNQTFQNFEVILVNDGSTDSTQDIIDKYCEKYPNFKVIVQENQGVANARNSALEVVSGDYIGFLDPDGDYFVPDAFYNFNEIISFHENRNVSPDLVIGSQITIDTWSKINHDPSNRNFKNILRSIVNFRNKLFKIKYFKQLSNNRFFKYNFHYYKSAKFLPFENEIVPHDKRIIWTMLILNKMFKREKLLEIGLKMPLLTHSSDAVFLFSFLYKCDKIVGCPYDFLIYKKRIFSDKSSLSQESNLDSVNAYYESYNIILKSFKRYSNNYRQFLENKGKNNDLKNFEIDYLEYIDLLRFKELQTLFIDMTYRLFWKTDVKTLIKVKEIILEFKKKIIPETWENIVNSNRDIDIDDLVVDPIKMAENPLITIVLDNIYFDNYSKNENYSNKDSNLNTKFTNLNYIRNKIDFKLLKRIISNIYNSHFPAFELIVSNDLFEELDESIQNKKNIHPMEYKSNFDFKNKAINRSKGEYLFFIDQDILFSPNLFKEMFDKINGIDYSINLFKEKINEVKSIGFNTKLIKKFPNIFMDCIKLFKGVFNKKSKTRYDFIISPMKSVLGDIIANKDEYVINKFSKRYILDSNIIEDSLISDKLIRKEFLKRINFKFSHDIKNDIKNLYSLGEFQKINKNYILSTDKYLKNPSISIIIDDMKITEKEINNLLESIYNQEFNSFEVLLNENLKFKNDINYLNMSNIKILSNNDFKNVSINKANAQYVLYINIPINYKSNDFKKLFFKFRINKNKKKNIINNKIIINNK
ncbi:putative glycosyltransferase EpsH [Methanobrevibacter cuticularis]|uniref:Putative glycosyltransferase EpsH n=1 Tax=Methanobrevibacter cuticularis TaxID=47311 RepID=A0A166CQW5_9EURY|nr:glycosyltransferase [Methanobrevibacter cuticularis]KZX16127.1 putative glycosyltransferase EpsH [Methanobrevibacter cuticularis]